MNQLEGTKFHFIGIGGIGMCGLAELLHNMGALVTGSDLSENEQTLRLKKIGITVYQGHDRDNIGEAKVVVFSSAVKANNVEYIEAREKNIPLIARAEALAEIMRLKRGVAIAGTHGKTTTTSLTASVFLQGQVDPTIVVGGRLDLIKSTAQLGDGEWLIAEADESDGSFNRLSPEVVVITNIDNDHMDHYKDFITLQKAFWDFASSIPFYGLAIVCGDDPRVRELFKDYPKKIIFYGTEASNDYYLRGSHGNYTVIKRGEELCQMEVPMPGRHNALNSLAAVICGLQAGISIADCMAGIKSFAGVDRRFQFKGEFNGVKVFDDYGHHPTEVLAVLDAFKEKFPQSKLKVIFQPHRYSRFESCWTDFLQSFENADELYILDVYRAGEVPRIGIDSQAFSKQISHRKSSYCNNTQNLISQLKEESQPGDIILTLGAGDVWKIGENLYK